MNEDVTRKLAAIMFTDIKGFSKKMGENESEAFEILKTHDALMRVMVTKNGGKVIKSIGDSFMVDFSSAVNAVKCAVDAQRKFYTFNKGKDEFHKIEIRIGIHLGDVIIRDNDIFGDGVNIAQRIEAITEPNRICVSSDIFNQVKNKMTVKGHAMGGMKLKNIAEPVDVFEILIPDIPEYSLPSPTAREAISQSKVELSIRQEAEEQKEAQRVEQAKVRVNAEHLKTEEKAKLIGELYAKADKYFQLGRLDDAEKALNNISELDPNFQATLEKRREEEEKEKEAQIALNKAHEFLKKRNFDEAEAAVSQVFRVYPLHVGAQQVLLQIEDERYKMEEEERTKKSSKESDVKAQFFSEEERQKTELFERARARLAAEQFAEAAEILRDVFKIDPNNNEARLLEEEIRGAEAAKIEENKRHTEEEAERVRRDQAETQKRLEENEKRRQTQNAELAERKARIRQIAFAIGALALAAILWLTVPTIWRQLFPRTASVALVQFTAGDTGSTSQDLAFAIPYLLAEDLSRCVNVTSVSPGSSLTYSLKADNGKALSDAMNVQFLISGQVKESGTKYSVTFRVVDGREQAPVFTSTMETDVISINKLRTDFVREFLRNVQVDANPESKRKLTDSDEAAVAFLRGFRLSHSLQLKDLDAAETSLRDALTIDPSMSRAMTALAEVLMTQFELGIRDPEKLQNAKSLIDEALKNPTSPFALSAQGKYLRLTGKLAAARAAQEKSVAYLPIHGEAYRELALVSMMEGNLDLAKDELSRSRTLEPQHPKVWFIEGLLALRKRSFSEADAAFQQALSHGIDDSLTTLQFRIPALVAIGNVERAMEFVNRQLGREPNNLFYLYLRGRIAQANVAKDYQTLLTNARNLARERIDRNPADLEARTYLALLLTRLGNFEDGQKEVANLGAMRPNAAGFAYLKARVFSIQKKKPECVAALRELMRLEYDPAKLVDFDLNWIAQEPEFESLVSLPSGSAN